MLPENICADCGILLTEETGWVATSWGKRDNSNEYRCRQCGDKYLKLKMPQATDKGHEALHQEVKEK